MLAEYKSDDNCHTCTESVGRIFKAGQDAEFTRRYHAHGQKRLKHPKALDECNSADNSSLTLRAVPMVQY